MNVVEVEVKLIGNKIDWMTGKTQESKVKIIVDEDKVEMAKRMTIKNMTKITREHLNKDSIASYVLYSLGSTQLPGGQTSIGSYLYGVKPNTRRIKDTPANVFTREVFKLLN